MRKYRGAFTLVEILVGFAILAVIAMMYLLFVRSSSKELQFSADHFNAVILSQKVAEDLIEELAVNPWGFETLGVDGAGSEQEVIEGRSIFFSFIEDTKPPYGKIDANIDGAITEQMQPLHESAEKFKFKVSGARLSTSGEAQNLMQGNVDFFWKTQTGRGEFKTSMQMFSPITAKNIDLAIALDQDTIDARLPAQVYGKSGQNLSAISAGTGENISALQALGRIALVTRDFVASEQYVKRKNKIAELTMRLDNTPITDLDDQFNLRKEIAEAWYDMAQVCFQVVAYLESQFAQLQAQGKFTSTTGSGFNTVTLQQNLMYYRIIYEYFAASIVQARYFYNSMLKADLMQYKGGKVQQQLILKLFDLYRVVAVLTTRPGGMNEFKTFLTRVKNLSEGRNPFLYRLATFEQSLLAQPDEWLKRYANLERLNQIIAVRVPQILDFIKNTTIQMIGQ